MPTGANKQRQSASLFEISFNMSVPKDEKKKEESRPIGWVAKGGRGALMQVYN